jgi:hypothetical protein
MRLALACAAGVAAAAIGFAAPAAPAFDPAKPFAGITAPAQWVARFRPGPPVIVPNDPFGNMTSREYWTQSWQGQNIDHPERTPASVKGSGGHGVVIKSPYPYKSAQEQYDAWLAAAHGGTKHTRADLPDWSGDWQGASDGVLGNGARVSDVYAAVADVAKPAFLQLLRGEWEGGHQWWPAAFCLPDAFGRLYWPNGVWHLMADDKMVLINEDRPENATRYIYTDGRGFLPKDLQFPQWYGASKGFWDGDELVVYTSQIKPWVITHALPEYNQLETVERMKRFGDEFLIDITLYDPTVFAFPWHDTATLHIVKDWTKAPSTWEECVSTNNVYMNSKGELAEHAPGEPGYQDASDPRPWMTAYKLWDDNHKDLAAHWKGVFDQVGRALERK